MPYYEIIVYYPRTHHVIKPTKQEAMDHIIARGLTHHTPHYTELWEMPDHEGGSGEQIGCYENSQLELVPTSNILVPSQRAATRKR